MERKSPGNYIPDGSCPGTTAYQWIGFLKPHTSSPVLATLDESLDEADGRPEKEVDTYRRQDNYGKIRSKPEDQY